MNTQTDTRRLYRSRDERMLAGVCGGVAKYFGWDPTLVRLAVALSLLLPGPQAIAYLVAWVVIPEEPWETAVSPASPEAAQRV